MIQRIIYVVCDAEIPRPEGGTYPCDQDAPSAMTEGEARKLARAAGWKVGHNRDSIDLCPSHRG